MASFQDKITQEKPGMSKNKEKKNRYDEFLPDPEQRILKKQQKKFKKLKNIIMASFQSKTGWKMLRKSENKNYRSDQFLPDPLSRTAKKFKN